MNSKTDKHLTSMLEMLDFREEPIVASFLWLFIFGIIFTGVEFIGASHQDTTGTIKEMTFVHGNQSTTVGMAFTSKGAAPVIATSGHPDKWSIVVNIDGHFHKIDCNTDQYYQHEIGDQVKVRRFYGYITGGNFDNKLLD